MKFHTEVKLIDRANNEIKRDWDLILFSVFSGIIAAIGIVLDNIYIIIGSMLIAPFLEPIVSTVIFLTHRMYKKFFDSLLSIGMVVAFAAISGFLTFFIIDLVNDLSIWVDPVSMINGNLYLSLIVAIIMGSVAMILWVIQSSFTLGAGVAITVSLVPPLVNTVSIFFAPDRYHYMFKDSLTLFLVNLFGILIGSFVTMAFFKRRESRV